MSISQEQCDVGHSAQNFAVPVADMICFFYFCETISAKVVKTPAHQNVSSSRSAARTQQRFSGSSHVTTHKKSGCLVHEAKFSPNNFFDPPPPVNKKQPAPTPEMMAKQHEYLTNPGNGFKAIGVGKAFVYDKTSHDLICYSDIQEISTLSIPDYDDLVFVARFLHKNKDFISPIPNSHKWGGQMWGIGWRVGTEKGVIVGRYLKISTISKDVEGYLKVSKEGARASEILSSWFESTADQAFQKNQRQMQETGTPGFAILNLPDERPQYSNDCANHLTFTTSRFANFPHSDSTDKSDFAFMFTYPTEALTGEIASRKCDNTEEFFPFPDFKFYLDFSGHRFGKVVWGAKKYRHFTLQYKEGNSHCYDRTSGSLQVNQKTSDTVESFYQGGFKNNPKRTIISDVAHIAERAAKRAEDNKNK